MGSGTTQRVRIVIVGAGFGGLGTAIRLKQRGIDDFVVLERAGDAGGTWRDNTYPGCTCDVPSHLYSFSFALNPDWSRTFSGQPEIWAYLRRCVDRFGLAPHLRYDHPVTGMRWDPGSRLWTVSSPAGDYAADILVVAGGPLSEPSTPDIPGLDSFAGTVFHSARWDHGYDLTGRDVAVIGTGASAIQFVPAIAGQVASLRLFQRTPPWILPRTDRRISAAERAVYRTVPGAQRLVRSGVYWVRELTGFNFLHPAGMRIGQAIARRHLRRSVPDPVLRERLTPRYTMGCKRVLLSNDYYPALQRSNVEVVTEAITAVRPDAVVTADGTAHRVDAIILGTGFHVTDMPAARYIVGRDGVSLAQSWHGTMSSYYGVAFAGFPNLFMMLGPNSGLGHNSVVFMIESAVRYVLNAIGHLDRTGLAAIEPSRAAQDRFTAWVDRHMAGTVWLAGGCRSWYLDPTGRNSTLWPSYSWRYRLATRRWRPGDHVGTPSGDRDPEPVRA